MVVISELAFLAVVILLGVSGTCGRRSTCAQEIGPAPNSSPNRGPPRPTTPPQALHEHRVHDEDS